MLVNKGVTGFCRQETADLIRTPRAAVPLGVSSGLCIREAMSVSTALSGYRRLPQVQRTWASGELRIANYELRTGLWKLSCASVSSSNHELVAEPLATAEVRGLALTAETLEQAQVVVQVRGRDQFEHEVINKERQQQVNVTAR